MSFTVWRARNIGMGDRFVVMGSGVFNNTIPFADIFVLAPGSEPPFKGLRFVRPRPEFPIKEEILNLVDPSRSAQAWAVGEIDRHLLKWYEQQPSGTPLPTPPRLEELGQSGLIHLWVCGISNDEISRIGKETKCRELRDCVEALESLPLMTGQPTA